MKESDEVKIELATQAISKAIDARLGDRIHEVSKNFDETVEKHIHELNIHQGTFTDYTALLKAVRSVEDSKHKAILLKQYIDIVSKNQGVRNEALTKLHESDIALRKERIKAKQAFEEKVLLSELEKSKLRSRLFNSKPIILFFMCFPILAGFLLIYWKEAYFFSFLIMVMWYGMSLALYFSQSNALADLIKVFSEKGGLLYKFKTIPDK
ncbi:MAG: hypothetical protein SD837_18270 [Candidatus Electrothrix scaldis]|nr:MAG: hypothetical protein SD837_18270 [Candidatus Electrothrix sp. GW3-3]